MKDIAIVYAVFGDRFSAEIAAVQMVERHLAACANIQPNCLSVYHWNDRMERAEETPVIFKTGLEQRTALMAALVAIHGYELPAISSWTATAGTEFANWVDASTKEGSGAGSDN